MLTNRIHNVLERIGVVIPLDKDASLEKAGLDSLLLALLIIELENEFNVQIPVMPILKEHYQTIATIEEHILELTGE